MGLLRRAKRAVVLTQESLQIHVIVLSRTQAFSPSCRPRAVQLPGSIKAVHLWTLAPLPNAHLNHLHLSNQACPLL
jgi:hypothetical protein